MPQPGRFDHLSKRRRELTKWPGFVSNAHDHNRDLFKADQAGDSDKSNVLRPLLNSIKACNPLNIYFNQSYLAANDHLGVHMKITQL